MFIKIVQLDSRGGEKGKLGGGEKGKPTLGFPLRFFWGRCPVGMIYHPKEGRISWNN